MTHDELLTKLREGVEGMQIEEGMYVTAFFEQGWRHHKLSVLALIEKLEAGE